MRLRAIAAAVLLVGTCATTGCAAAIEGTATLPSDVPATTSITVPSPTFDRASGVPDSQGAPPATASTASTSAPESGGPTAANRGGDDSVVAPPPASVTVPTLGEDNGDGAIGGDGADGADSAGAGGPEAAAFADRIRRATAGVTTLHGTLHLSTGPSTETQTFTERLEGGVMAAADITIEDRQAGTKRSLRVLMVGPRHYLGPESLLRSLGLDTGGRPWVQLTDTAPNRTVRQLADQVDRIADRLGPNDYIQLAGASTGPMTIGTENVAGGAATHYRLAVNIGKLVDMGVASQRDAGLLDRSGVTQIPIDIWLDMRDRPVQMEMELSVQGQRVKMVATLGRFDEPVSITAPDPTDVAPG